MGKHSEYNRVVFILIFVFIVGGCAGFLLPGIAEALSWEIVLLTGIYLQLGHLADIVKEKEQ